MPVTAVRPIEVNRSFSHIFGRHASLCFRVHGSGLLVPGSWFRVRGSEFKIQISRLVLKGSRFMVQGLGCGAWGCGFRVKGPGLIVWGVVSKVQSLGFGVYGEGLRFEGGWCRIGVPGQGIISDLSFGGRRFGFRLPLGSFLVLKTQGLLESSRPRNQSRQLREPDKLDFPPKDPFKDSQALPPQT